MLCFPHSDKNHQSVCIKYEELLALETKQKPKALRSHLSAARALENKNKNRKICEYLCPSVQQQMKLLHSASLDAFQTVVDVFRQNHISLTEARLRRRLTGYPGCRLPGGLQPLELPLLPPTLLLRRLQLLPQMFHLLLQQLDAPFLLRRVLYRVVMVAGDRRRHCGRCHHVAAGVERVALRLLLLLRWFRGQRQRKREEVFRGEGILQGL